MRPEIQAVRGMHDVLPSESRFWSLLESTISGVVSSYGYAEIRMPILEKTELFRRSIGDVTDIVEKEMYSFVDRNGENLTLRPEGTASCVRACLENGLFLNPQNRLWYLGPMFRHERPQKGRYRQFHQLGVEAFGIAEPEIDAELIIMTSRLWKKIGIDKNLTLELNSLGSAESRRHFRDDLVKFLEVNIDLLDDDSKRRLNSNPLRVLDSKNLQVRELVTRAPRLFDYLDADSKTHYERLKSILLGANISFTENPNLVRGLDYYSRTVFEWTTDKLGAQSTVCAGGRYDNLVEMLGGKPMPACGFAIGIERILTLVRETSELKYYGAPDIYLIGVGEKSVLEGILISEEIRDGAPNLSVVTNCGGGSFKTQMKRADKSGAWLAVLVGDDEIARNEVTVKPLRGGGDQISVSREHLVQYLRQNLHLNEGKSSGSL